MYIDIACRVGTTALAILGSAAAGAAWTSWAGPVGAVGGAAWGAAAGTGLGIAGSGRVCDQEAYNLEMRGACRALEQEQGFRELVGQELAVEASLIGGVGSAAFLTISPWVAQSLGMYLACQSVGCAVGTSMAGSFSGGFSASILSLGTGTGLYKVRYSKWLKENAGKYFVNKVGKLEQIPLAFVLPAVTPLNPVCTYLLLNSYFVYKGYRKKVKEIDCYAAPFKNAGIVGASIMTALVLQRLSLSRLGQLSR